MDNPSYVTLARQTGLLRSMDIVANNLANLSTTGFRREGALFVEVVDRLEVLGGSASQAAARVRVTDYAQGALRETGGTFDLAIEGDGFFQVEGDQGPLLTRFGSFVRNPAGELTGPQGRRVLDPAGAPIFLPAEARSIEISTDGSISADGQPIGAIAVVDVENKDSLTRLEGGLFTTEDAVIPAPDSAVFQGFVERSNVDPVRELTRMIDIQRSYEMGQAFLQTEHDRMRQSVRTISGGT